MVRKGVELSRQSSHARRAPNEKAVPVLREAQTRLRVAIEAAEADCEHYRLLALTHETLLEYREAIHALEMCISLSAHPVKNDLKRLARYREQLLWWATCPVSPRELAELGDFLDRMLCSAPLEHSFRWTLVWLTKRKHPAPEKVIAGLEQLGAYDDFQLLSNVIDG
jgi:hypothetical protein